MKKYVAIANFDEGKGDILKGQTYEGVRAEELLNEGLIQEIEVESGDSVEESSELQSAELPKEDPKPSTGKKSKQAKVK